MATEGDKVSIFKNVLQYVAKSAMSAKVLEVSLLGVGTVLRLERDARSTVKWRRHASTEYAPLPRVQLTLHATRPAPYGASRLMQRLPGR